MRSGEPVRVPEPRRALERRLQAPGDRAEVVDDRRCRRPARRAGRRSWCAPSRPGGRRPAVQPGHSRPNSRVASASHVQCRLVASSGSAASAAGIAGRTSNRRTGRMGRKVRGDVRPPSRRRIWAQLSSPGLLGAVLLGGREGRDSSQGSRRFPPRFTVRTGGRRTPRRWRRRSRPTSSARRAAPPRTAASRRPAPCR